MEGWRLNAAPMSHTTLASTSATTKLSMVAAGSKSTTLVPISAVLIIWWNALAHIPVAVVKRATIPIGSFATTTNCTLCAPIARTILLETSAVRVLPSPWATFLCGMPAVVPSRFTTRSLTSVTMMSCMLNAAARLMILAANLVVTAKSYIWWVVNTRGAADQLTTIPRITSASITRQLYTSAATTFTTLSGRADK